MEEIRKSEEMSLEELEAQHVELLPDREEMLTLNVGAFAYAYQGAFATGSVNNVEFHNY